MNCNIESHDFRRETRWLLTVFVISGVGAALLGGFSLEFYVPSFLESWVNGVASMVPTIDGIAVWTSRPELAKFLLSMQWTLAPIYIFIWMILTPPWSSKVKSSVIKNGKMLTGKQRLLFLIVGIFLILYFSSDTKLLGLPTIFNGKFAFPPSNAIPIVRPIYSSWTYLSLYAWASVISECTALWMLVFMLFNINGIYSRKK